MQAISQRVSFLIAAVVAALLSLAAAPARAAHDPREPIYLWGIQRGCATDDALTRAVAERLQLLGTPVHTVAGRASGEATRCLGSECAALFAKSCGEPRASAGRGILLGGHIEEQRDGNELRSRIRLWRTDLGTANDSFLRYEHLTRHCSGDRCTPALSDLVVTLVGQLLAETTPDRKSVAAMHAAQPPYCDGNSSLPAFFCAPFNLQAACGEGGDDGEAPAGAELLCKAADEPEGPGACDCTQQQTCSAAARAACPAGRAAAVPRLPLLRKGLGGSLLAVGGILLGAGVLMTLNNQEVLTLRRSVSCAGGGQNAEKCYATTPEIGTSIGIGIGLLAGGAVMLWDPQKLFSDKQARSQSSSSASLRTLASPTLTTEEIR